MYKDKKISVIIAAAGKGMRVGGLLPKQFMKLGGEAVIVKTVRAFDDNELIDDIVIVTNDEYKSLCSELMSECEFKKIAKIVPGGKERQDSVYNAIMSVCEENCDAQIVLIHDGARPFIDNQIILNVIEAAAHRGAAVPCVAMKDSLRRIEGTEEKNGKNVSVQRSEYLAVQTPQGFDLNILKRAYEEAFQTGYYGTDDASLVERLGYDISLVEGSYRNIKITTKEDFPMEYRIGTGFDVHKFEIGRKLILGGVEVPYEKGLAGHSDADVLVHALMDALLGAAALGDIGRHFPDTDDSYKGISSLVLLGRVTEILHENMYAVGNIDVTVIAQAPKIAPYIEAMKDKISETMKLEKSRINIKGTTTEKLGFTGRKEGIAAEAVCTLYR